MSTSCCSTQEGQRLSEKNGTQALVSNELGMQEMPRCPDPRPWVQILPTVDGIAAGINKSRTTVDGCLKVVALAPCG